MTDVVNPKSASPDQLLPYHKKISAEGKALMKCFISYTYMVLNSAEQDIIIPVPRCFYAPQIWFLVISRTVSVGVPAISSPKISLSLPPCIISASLDLADA